MKKIRLFFSIIAIILVIFFIFIYIFINNFDKKKIISDIEKKYEIKVNENNKTKINIFPILKLSANLEIIDYKDLFYIDNININISQPLFLTSGNLDILFDNLDINNINFSDVSINGSVNYLENYLAYRDNLENLFDSIYNINGKITLRTTNEEKFLISFLKMFFEKLENKGNQKFAFSELINAFGNEKSSFKGRINKNKYILKTNKIEIINRNNKIFINGEYNYNNNFIDINLDLFQNEEVYLTTFIKGNLNNPHINFDKNSKFFQNLNSNENNLIEESIIKFLNNFFDFND
jgi:glutaredoxin-related protein|tara:strand:- start:1035 stop:1913 length:879 start_codon:yes stop_codon:yes gene_type:complete